MTRVLAIVAMLFAGCAPGYKRVSVTQGIGLHRGDWNTEAATTGSVLPVQATCSGPQVTWLKIRSVRLESVPSQMTKLPRVRVAISSDRSSADFFDLKRDEGAAGHQFVGTGDRIELTHPRSMAILAEGPPSLPDETVNAVRAFIELDVACYQQVPGSAPR